MQIVLYVFLSDLMLQYWRDAPHSRRKTRTPVGLDDRKDRSVALERPYAKFQLALRLGCRRRWLNRSGRPTDRALWQRKSSMERIR